LIDKKQTHLFLYKYLLLINLETQELQNTCKEWPRWPSTTCFTHDQRRTYGNVNL